MDLILWRHAHAEEAHDSGEDLKRPLSAKGKKQAARLAGWLNQQLPDSARILSSPALRAVQTAQSLGRDFKQENALAPSASVADLLKAAKWPDSARPILIVGHEPVLSQTLAQLLQCPIENCVVKKGAVWWLRSRDDGTEAGAILLSVITPDKV
jgi:phosphohistidine phosphatase